ncbi:MAG: hypothetical protein ABIJ00_05450 [Candidatus Eisenbacteria bacterium]
MSYVIPCIGLLLLAYSAAINESSPVADSLFAAPYTPDCDASEFSDIVILGISDHSDTAISGSQFAEMTKGWSGRQRQEAALREPRAGNVPQFLHHFKPVVLEYKTGEGRTIHAVVWVAPDYLAIGSDDDFLRIPLTRPTAVIIAAEYGCVLPTRKIVDAVANQADFRFEPQPLPPGKMMRSSEYYVRHNQLIEEQRRGRPLGELVAGHKKDVVLSNRLLGPERIAIYGWHRKNGEPIQPLSTVHDARYADYSHGIRLVHMQVCIDGELRSICDVLLDPNLAPVLSYEGLIPRIKRLMRW